MTHPSSSTRGDHPRAGVFLLNRPHPRRARTGAGKRRRLPCQIELALEPHSPPPLRRLQIAPPASPPSRLSPGKNDKSLTASTKATTVDTPRSSFSALDASYQPVPATRERRRARTFAGAGGTEGIVRGAPSKRREEMTRLQSPSKNHEVCRCAQYLVGVPWRCLSPKRASVMSAPCRYTS